jgi:hypothetical protein
MEESPPSDRKKEIEFYPPRRYMQILLLTLPNRRKSSGKSAIRFFVKKEKANSKASEYRE